MKVAGIRLTKKEAWQIYNKGGTIEVQSMLGFWLPPINKFTYPDFIEEEFSNPEMHYFLFLKRPQQEVADQFKAKIKNNHFLFMTSVMLNLFSFLGGISFDAPEMITLGYMWMFMTMITMYFNFNYQKNLKMIFEEAFEEYGLKLS